MLDAALDALLKQMTATPSPKLWEAGTEQARAMFRAMRPLLSPPGQPVGKVEQLAFDGPEGPVPVRIYTPVGKTGTVTPACVYFHGGGWVIGDLDTHDELCRVLANESGARVLSVDYRLAPEHKFPAAYEDALAALVWAEREAGSLKINPNRLAVAGDSAGGNLAAVVAQGFKREGRSLAAQILIYPCTQFLKMAPTQLRVPEGYMVTQAAQDFFIRQYLGDKANVRDWRASPLITDDLAGLAPAYVVTAGFDPLLDEGKAYADKLAACGVPTTYREYRDQVHGFFNMTAVLKSARAAITDAGLWLAKTVSG